MKRKTILIGLLCLWLLIFCTLFSAWNQEQMQLLVVVDSSSNGTNRVSLDCLNYDENGRHLYTVVEKTGWSSGLQAHEVSPENYQVNDTSLTLYDFGEPILYSSKPPQDGDDVRMVSSQTISDVFLIVRSDGATETVEMPSAKSPFLQGQAKAALRAQGISISETDTVIV